MALTATELTRLRDLTGGRTVTNERDHLTDTELQAESTAAAAVWDTTVVYVLRRRLGMATGYVNKNMDLNSENLEAYVKHLRGLLEDAEALAALQPGVLSIGSLDHNLDTDYDDMDIA
jgi:hypothetical protein